MTRTYASVGRLAERAAEITARDDGSTHWDGCWESHHDCAIVMLADARAEAALFKAGHAQLAAHVERLREALQEADDAAGEWVESSEELQWPVSVRKALAGTPAQSLAEHDAEIVERCAAIVLDEVDGAEEERARDSMLSRIAAAVRSLKPASEKKP